MGWIEQLDSSVSLGGATEVHICRNDGKYGKWIASSTPVRVAGFYWSLEAKINRSWCDVRVVCNKDNLSNVWICKASYEISLYFKSTMTTGTHLFSAQDNTVTEIVGNCYPNQIGYGPFVILLTINIHPDIGIRRSTMIDFSQQTNHSDVVLNVSGRKFHVNKSILAIHSSFFDRLFNSEFQEKNQTEIELKDLDPDEFEAFLGVIYPSTNAITEENVSSMLKLADRFNVESVMISCEDFLSRPEQCQKIESLKLAGDYKLPKVVWNCLDKIEDAVTIKEMAKQKGFKELSSAIKSSILEKLVEF